MSAPPTAARRGRPRDESLDAEILDATVDELIDHGLSGLTIEGVAQRAGVAKTTVYRRWSDAADLAMCAARRIKFEAVDPPDGTVRDQLVWLLGALRAQWGDPRWAAVMRRVAADGTTHPGLYDEHRARLVAPHIEVMREVLRRGVRDGTIRPDLDLEWLRLMLVGPVVASAMTLRPGIDDEQAAAMVDVVLRGAAP
ncbi:TetR/AcrR family transcriptional regulator [Jatrophihabitans endophyticus]|uniref:TetR/AcrR family transcriptional regulator n=1 Tax=Jatrophihabitans endophyticus TaxID=1206085 RepID=UPI001A078F8F|nr:TetR/AcrR family transcriptional regulator [Jatrophihabitans endophyticus]MBE7187474.1 TetR/AcrR family transcriptional regulator [Jatrophihabitans endophyticus]